MQKLKSERHGKAKVEVLEEEDVEGHPVLQHLKDGKSKRVRKCICGGGCHKNKLVTKIKTINFFLS